MISFIIIGLNEGWKLKKCLESVILAIEQNYISEFEILYIDSKSSDNSIELAKSFNKVKIILLTGNCNAAIARNIGVKESSGSSLFLIDGDMELNSDFLGCVIDKQKKLKYDYVTGQLINRHYNNKAEPIGEEVVFKKLRRDTIEKTTGGVFIIKRKYWELLGGMKTKYYKSQDLDFGLRMAKTLNIFVVRKAEVIAYHNTLAYYNKSRVFHDIIDFKKLLFKGVLLRDHFFNKHILKRLIRMDFNLIILVFSLLLSIVSIYSLLIYVAVIILRSITNQFLKGKNMLILLVIYLTRDIGTLLGFFFFYPKEQVSAFAKVQG